MLRSDRRVLLCAVSLVMGRVRGDLSILAQLSEELESLLGEQFFLDAPFNQIGIAIRYGEKTNLRPDYDPILEEGGVRELPIAIEVEMAILRRKNSETVYPIIKQALLDGLIAVAERYALNGERLRQERAALGDVISNATRLVTD